MSPRPKPPEDLVDRLHTAEHVLITSHIHPDGDSVGTSLALAMIFLSMGKPTKIWHRDMAPRVYGRLPGAQAIHLGVDSPIASQLDDFDTIVALECPTLDRTGLETVLADRVTCNIDHHLGNSFYGEHNWVESDAPSVGEMVFRLSKELGVELEKEVATLLLLTLYTDTGGFRFSNATTAAFVAAAQLSARGAKPERVAQWIYESQPLSAIRLLSEMLETLELSADGHVATATVTLEMLEASGATAADTEGLIDHPRSIEGVDAVALLRQTDATRTKVSLRSRGEIDVATIAAVHGGGGHRNAAGFSLDGHPRELRADIARQLAAAL